MDEWWTYRPSDFLLFSRETYYALFEQYNASVWPLHLVAVILAVAILRLRAGNAPWTSRAIASVLALQWAWVAWAFHLEHFSSINPIARYFAAGFVAQAALLALAGMPGALRFSKGASRHDRGIQALFVVALLVPPILGVALGRSWRQVDLLGMTPDPTAIGTLAIVVSSSTRAAAILAILPLLWCVLAGVMLWTLGSAEAVLPLGAAAFSVAVLSSRWRGSRQ